MSELTCAGETRDAREEDTDANEGNHVERNRDDTSEQPHPDTRDDAHLRDVDVGAGCTEIWEHLAEQREE